MAANVKYALSPLVEYQLVYATSTQPRFFQKVGYAIEASKLPTEAAGLLISAAQQLSQTAPVKDFAHPAQLIRQWVQQGKYTNDQLNAAIDYAILAEDLAHSDLDILTSLVVPLVKRSRHKDAVEGIISDFGKGVPVERALKQLTDISEIGSRSHNVGVTMSGSFDDIVAAAEAGSIKNPLPTGILEIDAMLRGGLEEAALGVVMANSGDGKSLFLGHAASEAMWRGLDVGYITLELGEGLVQQRIYCNLLNMTAQELKDNTQEAVRRYQLAKQKIGMGNLKVAYLSPKVTTPAHVREWVRSVCDENFTCDVLIVDYADKMAAGKGKAQRSYEEMEVVYQALRDITAEHSECRWLWTATQSRGRESRKKKLGLEDVADSMNKIRIADLVMAIYRTEEDCTNDLIRFTLPKRRNAAAHGEVGPLPMDAEHGRIVTVGRREPW